MALPALAAANVYMRMTAPIEPPFFARTVHPASPTQITVHDKNVNLDTEENPFLRLETSNPDEFRRHVENGRRVYYQNCLPCHGEKGEGDEIVVQRPAGKAVFTILEVSY